MPKSQRELELEIELLKEKVKRLEGDRGFAPIPSLPPWPYPDTAPISPFIPPQRPYIGDEPGWLDRGPYCWC